MYEDEENHHKYLENESRVDYIQSLSLSKMEDFLGQLDDKTKIALKHVVGLLVLTGE